MPSVDAQQSLFDLAWAPDLGKNVRKIAVEALRDSIRFHGILLTNSTLRIINDMYNIADRGSDSSIDRLLVFNCQDNQRLPMLRKPTDDCPQSIAGFIGTSPAMQEVYAMTHRVAASTASVLLVGETGTGKELIARAIHELSQRGSGPFVRVNCGALSESLLESELFGHVRGSFTGAVANRAGRFEAAHTGTIFLDEINSTTPKLQVKLLRVLQEREFERVGDTETIQVDTRVIAASNRELLDEVAKETFREDLYYRLNVVPIYLPPLRGMHRHSSACQSLPRHLLSGKYTRYDDHTSVCDGRLTQHHWPGNVRELQNVVERCVIMSDSDELTLKLLPPAFRGEQSTAAMQVGVVTSTALLVILLNRAWHLHQTAMSIYRSCCQPC